MKVFQKLLPYIGLIVFLLAAFLIFHQIKHYKYSDILASVHEIPVHILFLGFFLTVLNYLTLSGYDFLALKFLDKKLPAAKVMIASLIGFTVSNNAGHAIISGPSVRYRFYKDEGVSGSDMVKLTVFMSITYLLSMTTLAVTAFFTFPQTQLQQFSKFSLISTIVYSALVFLLAYWIMILFLKKPLTFGPTLVKLPSPKITLLQTLLGVTEIGLASLVLYVFLRCHTDISFISFLLIFLIAQFISLYSQVPGGLGVFESIFLLFLSEHSQNILASLILYRITYYFIPFLLSSIFMVTYSLYEKREILSEKTEFLRNLSSQNIPVLFSILLMIAGAILLFSGVTPTSHSSISMIKNNLPVFLIEFSHLAGSISGVLLLFLARAVRLRVNAAYTASIVLLLVGIIASLLKGFDWQEALVLSVMLLLIIPTKSYFYRESTLMNTPFTRAWFCFIFIIIFTALWIGVFSYKHINYQDELWWKFTYKGDASRFLRSTFAIICLMCFMSVWRLFRSPKVNSDLPTEEDLKKLSDVVTNYKYTQSYLSLLGDKQLLWSTDKISFIMYRPESKYWIVMGDPVGSEAEREKLVWQLSEMADKKGCRLVFYQVSKENLSLYLDAGLIPVKIGEEALVDLTKFGLEGSARSGLRQTVNKFKKLENITFEILEKEEVAKNVSAIKEISNEWLADKKGGEKGFSLGFFKESYIKACRLAVVKQDEKIVAFANLWENNTKYELTIDLMRYSKDAPGAIMEWLFIQLMLWGKQEGYNYFSLGMAPLAGLEKHIHAPLWHKIGNFIFEHGDEFYNFEGLRQYKDKFDPVWQPKYMAVPDGFSIPPVLLTVTRLISGGKLSKLILK